MCGITAAIALDRIHQAALTDQHRMRLQLKVAKSLAKVYHRGPDSHDVWISDDNRVALGFTRLAINDLSGAGEQPFHSEHGVHAVVNGEIYMEPKERNALREFHDFRGRSDCEVVIALYLKYGQAFASKLRGEFAICLYDSKRKVFFAARDRYGIKPLFWTIVDDHLLLCSEAKGFLPFDWKPKWDLRPGYYMICSAFNEHTERLKYWDLTYPNRHAIEKRTESEMITELRDKLLDAVKCRLAADVPIGFYLSGGIDSAAMCGMAMSIIEGECLRYGYDFLEIKKEIKCFCIGFEKGSEFDEGPIAQRTADMLGLELITDRMDETKFAENFVDATYISEHHNPDLNYIGKFVLSELAHDHGFKVVLSGEGSDEHFGGYWHFHPDFLRESDQTYPKYHMSEDKRMIVTSALEVASKPGYKGTSANFTNNTSSIARRNLNNTSIASHLWTVTMADFALWTKCYGDLDHQETRANNPDNATLSLIQDAWHPLHTSQYIWIKSILPNLILACMGDRMEMAHSLEGRPPFLDHHLTEYVNGLPPNMKIKYDPLTNELTEKWILREAAQPFILDELYRRKKHPFSAPIGYRKGGPLHVMLAGLVTRENVEQLGFLDEEMVAKRFADAFSDNGDPNAMRYVFTVAQWIVLSQRLGIEKAQTPGW
ncbi:MAG: hypothetical protein M1821_003127 [Bathelium mastoideum]|nr:MAG: hypothetical protein M1821_003127 [Bathelium mastoideum]